MKTTKNKQVLLIKSTQSIKKEKKGCTSRQLKVYKKYLERSYHNFVLLPEIRLCGKWLDDLGFECGLKLKLQCTPKRIVISIAGKQEKV